MLAQGREQKGPSEGILCIKQAWPATIRTIKGDHDRFQQTYFSAFQARAASQSSNSFTATALTSVAGEHSRMARHF